MPYKCPYYEKDESLSTFAFFTPLLTVLAFMFTTLLTVGSIVREKSAKMKVNSFLKNFKKFIFVELRFFFFKKKNIPQTLK